MRLALEKQYIEPPRAFFGKSRSIFRSSGRGPIFVDFSDAFHSFSGLVFGAFLELFFETEI